MKNYNSMSDFEINKRVAEALGLSIDNGYGFIDSDGNVVCYDVISNSDGEPYSIEVRVNYCNNPADAWPVIQDNKINLAWDDIRQTWVAYSVGARHNATSANPLRAAMEVFLSMEEARRGV